MSETEQRRMKENKDGTVKEGLDRKSCREREGCREQGIITHRKGQTLFFK